MALHEIVGTIVASAALALAIYVFIRTLDYQSYKDADSEYRDVLKIGTEVRLSINHLLFRYPSKLCHSIIQYTYRPRIKQLQYILAGVNIICFNRYL